MKGIVRKIMATVLTGAMMVSVFIGSGVYVKAATYPVEELELIRLKGSTEDEIKTFVSSLSDCEVLTAMVYDGIPKDDRNNFFDDFMKKNNYDTDKTYNIYWNGIVINKMLDFGGMFLTPVKYENNQWMQTDNNEPKIYGDSSKPVTNPDNTYLIVRKIQNSNASATEIKKESKPSAPVHIHSYNWNIVTEATESCDGLELYQCSCGDVQARSVIPASQAYVSKFRNAIKNAPANGTVTYDSKMNHTFSDYIIKRLAERTDVTTVIDFKWQNKDYTMTIPAGVDYTPFFADTENFYGYFCFAQMTGASIVSK